MKKYLHILILAQGFGGNEMIRYYKLFDLLNRRGMKKTDLLEVISAPTLAKISKGKNIQTDSIDKICLFLNCQPSDIMEVFFDEDEIEKNGAIDYEKPITQVIESYDGKILDELMESEFKSKIENEDEYKAFIEKIKEDYIKKAKSK